MTARGHVPAAGGGAGSPRLPDVLALRLAGETRLDDRGNPLTSMIDIQSMLDELLRSLSSLLEADAAVLRLHDPTTGELAAHAALGLDAGELTSLGSGEGVCGLALAGLEAVRFEDVKESGVRPDGMPQRFRGAYSTPMLTLGREVMGTLTLYSTSAFAPVDSEVRLIDSYARQTAEMVERARLHGEARALAARELLRSAQLRGLAEAAVHLTALTSVESILAGLAEQARAIIGAPWATASYGERTAAAGLRPNGHLLAVPLRFRDGREAGRIQVGRREAEEAFTAGDEAVLVQLATLAAAAFETAGLLERERAAREEAEEIARFQRLLSDASHAFSTSLELGETLDAITGIAVPALGDYCAIHLVGESGAIELARDAGIDHPLVAEMKELARAFPVRADQPHGAGFAIRTGLSEVLPRVPDAVLETLAADQLPLERWRALRLEAGMVVPLPARGRTLGALSLARISDRPYTPTQVAFADDLGRRAAVAVDNATRFTLQREVAAALQRSLLPQALPMASALTAASRYLPGASGAQIGGDWYDLIDLGEGRIGLVVGDVMGRGIPAASVMGHLRAAVRAYALDGHAPAALLERLDRVVGNLDETQLTTCLYGVFDPGTNQLTIAAAGHLPPLVLQPGEEPRFLHLDPGLPLGVGGGTFVESRVPLAPGSTVLLYTDGLVEGPDCPVDEGMERLRLAAAPPAQSPDELCDRLLRALGRDGDHDDDTALLAVTLHGRTATGDSAGVRHLITLPPAPESASLARAFVERILRGSGYVGHAEIAVLLVSELATNALRHARTPLEVQVAVGDGTIRVDVADESVEAPRMREHLTVTDEGGRGMLLVDSLADRWGVERLPPGKRVWVELDVPPG